jgi:hypothetical protein
MAINCPYVDPDTGKQHDPTGTLTLPRAYDDHNSPAETRTVSHRLYLPGVCLTSRQLEYIAAPPQDAANGCVYHVKDGWPCPEAGKAVVAKTIRSPLKIVMSQIQKEVDALRRVTRA